MSGSFVRLLAALLGAIVLLPALSHAQSACAVPADIVTAARWEGLLNRSVTLIAGHTTIGDALDRLAATTGIRFSYSADALPLAQRVCASYEAVPVGAVLTGLLRGTGLEPVVADAEHIVLAPTRARSTPNERPETASPEVVPLEPVHVRGRASSGAPGAAAGNAVVIDGRRIAQRGSTTLGEVLNGAVPGVWLWHDGGGTYGSVRGASSFHTTAPRVYIDGIEVANSQLLTRISPASIDRIEIIRGPQGAALFGANALGGIINIVTRRDHAIGGSPLRYVHSGVGISASDFAGRTALSQDHAVGVAAGTDGRAAGLNVSVGTLGEYAPGAHTEHIAADAYGRLAGARGVLTATLRFLAERAGTASRPLLPDSRQQPVPSPGPASVLAAGLLSMRQYTAGISASHQPGSHWRHTLTAGVDGYNVAEPTAGQAGPPAAPEMPLGALRATARVSSARDFAAADGATGSVTFAVEHSLLRRHDPLPTALPLSLTRDEQPATRQRPEPRSRRIEQVASSTGLSAQANLLWHDRLLLTGGLRLERNGSPSFTDRWAVLPVLGGTLLARHGDADVRLRTAFGRAIRWPAAPASSTAWRPAHSSLRFLVQPPEEQTGVEAGVDVRIGGFAALHVTRFTQSTTGVTQPSPRPLRHATVQPAYQSVGNIENRGWELEASLTHGRLALGGTLSLVDSRVRSLADRYDGELRAGDRMLAVPARTASLSASWTAVAWSATVTAARAADWINYDRRALLGELRDVDRETVPNPRSYWRRYDGFTHLNATATRQLSQRFTLTLTGTNLLGRQLGEPDNLTIVPGRTFAVGLRAMF